MGATEFLAACGLRPTATKPFDPIETIYAVDYITVTPDRGTQVASTPSSTPSAMDAEEGAAAGEIEWFCACCGQRFRTVEDLKKHAAAEHGWRLPEIHRVAEPTYSEFLCALHGAEREADRLANALSAFSERIREAEV